MQAFAKRPELELEALGEPPLLWGTEPLVMDVYLSMRGAANPDAGVDPLAFLALYERILGPSDAETVTATLRELESVHREAAKSHREGEIERRKKADQPPLGRAGRFR